MPNRLASSTSPYLQQHADNPVDWWEWSPEAFAEARRRDVPIFLSVGYAACHWCHVMAHESFEDESTAGYLNANFVSIKVDREERPDVDAVYMQATTAMTGHGGWPMSCFIDHDGSPFYCGTYFPDQPRHGQPSFMEVLTALSEAWVTRRDEVAAGAESVRAHLDSAVSAPPIALSGAEFDAAATTLANEFDPLAGGFGGAPKFPPSMVLEFLRRYSATAGDTTLGRQAVHMVARTAGAMAGGGIYDQLGGGFARYAVDRGWVVPHFEKMLYDNAQLLGLYARLGNARIAQETADFMLRELCTSEGGFASALDADTEGEEGRFYVWTRDQLIEALGEDDGAWAAGVFGVTDEGTFEHGTSTLQLRHFPEDASRLARVRNALFEARATRVAPARDDKVVAAWNGLAISGLCAAGLLLEEPAYIDAAVLAGELLLGAHTPSPGVLLRVSRDGVAGGAAGVLEDYGCVASGYLDLLQATGDVRWLEAARELLDSALARFGADDGGFFDTATDAEVLVARPREFSDNASPSGQSAMVHALAVFAAVTGEGRYRSAAEGALASLGGLATRAPRFAGWALAAGVAMVDGPVEVAVVGEPGELRDALANTARRLPGAVVLVSDGPRDDVPLLAGRTAVDGKPAAYVCRNLVCERPVSDPAQLTG